MKLVIISGRSGSGKSTALDVLEDIGFYCIDNLPAGLLPALVETTQNKNDENNRLAVCIDARNHTDDIAMLDSIKEGLPASVDVEIVYLDASSNILIKRFSETRRKHPLSNEKTSLKAALEEEKQVLAPMSLLADLHINTDQMNVHSLRDMIKKRLQARVEHGGMSLMFSSFGFKNGIPVDADFVFDVRCLSNPHWVPELRDFHGQEQPIIDFLSQQKDVMTMKNDIQLYLEKWLPAFANNNRSYVTIAIGCTGGRHRSVYITERLAEHFTAAFSSVQTAHRDLC